MPTALLPSLPTDLQQRLNSARELIQPYVNPSTSPSLVPTEIEALDTLLAGGLCRGHMIELIGHRSSGRFSTVLSLLAVITAAGEAAALIDLGNNLDPRQATRSGVDLQRLLWIRPRSLKEVLASAETLLTGGFPLVAIDLGTPPISGGRGSEASWLRLSRAACSHKAIVFVSSPYRVSGTAAAGVVKASRGRARWTDRIRTSRLLTGMTSHLRVEKLRGRQGGDSSTLRFASYEASTFGMAS